MCSKEIICEEKENTYIISNTQTKPVSKSILILSMGTFFLGHSSRIADYLL